MGDGFGLENVCGLRKYEDAYEEPILKDLDHIIMFQKK